MSDPKAKTVPDAVVPSPATDLDPRTGPHWTTIGPFSTPAQVPSVPSVIIPPAPADPEHVKE